MSKQTFTGADILRILRSDPAYMAENAEKERRRDQHMLEVNSALAPAVRSLQEAGFDCAIVDDLRGSGQKYEKAVPILIEALRTVQHPAAKQIVVRALSVPWARPAAAKPLIEEFLKLSADFFSLKWTIGNALSVVGDESVADELIALAKERRHGETRQMVVMALGKLRKTRPVPVLMGLLDDPLVAPHAIDSLGRLRATEATGRLQELLHSERSVIRKEAAKALKKIAGGAKRK